MRVRALALNVVVVLAVFVAAPTSNGATVTWKRAGDGVHHAAHEHSLGSRKLKLNVVKVDLRKAFVEPVMADPRGESIVPLQTTSGRDMYSPVPRTVKAIAEAAPNRRRGGRVAVAAINGGFFFHQEHAPRVYSWWNLAYVVTRNGSKYYPWNHPEAYEQRKKEAKRAIRAGARIASNRLVRAVRDVGHRRMLIFGFTPAPGGQLVQGVRIDDHDLTKVRRGEMALGAGGAVFPPVRDPSLNPASRGKTSRTALCLAGPRTLALLTVDRPGVTILELAALIQGGAGPLGALGTPCTDAVALDGGGSTQMWVDGSVVSKNEGAEGRSVLSALVVYATK